MQQLTGCQCHVLHMQAKDCHGTATMQIFIQGAVQLPSGQLELDYQVYPLH